VTQTTENTRQTGLIPLTLIWSDLEGQYLGSQGEEEVVLTWTELRDLIENGRADSRGLVTSIVLWLPNAVIEARRMNAGQNEGQSQRSQGNGTDDDAAS